MNEGAYMNYEMKQLKAKCNRIPELNPLIGLVDSSMNE
jgi:hypothetical protein